jgi:hypothetical protein
MRYLLFITLCLSITNAYALLNYSRGEWGSGGGNAIVCFNPGSIDSGDSTINIISEIRKNNNQIKNEYLKYISSIEMFDLYDAKKSRGLNQGQTKIIEILSTESEFDYIDKIGKLYKQDLPYIEKLIAKTKLILDEGSFYLAPNPIKHQDDIGTVTLPGKDCTIITMAAQVNYGNYYEVHIDERLYNHPTHSKLSKAVLILHELLYSYDRKENKAKDSGATRSLVKILISKSKYNTEQFIVENIDKLGFNSAEWIIDAPGGEEFRVYYHSITAKEMEDKMIYFFQTALLEEYRERYRKRLEGNESFVLENAQRDCKKFNLSSECREIIKRDYPYQFRKISTFNSLCDELIRAIPEDNKKHKFWKAIKSKYKLEYKYIQDEVVDGETINLLINRSDLKLSNKERLKYERNFKNLATEFFEEARLDGYGVENIVNYKWTGDFLMSKIFYSLFNTHTVYGYRMPIEYEKINLDNIILN